MGNVTNISNEDLEVPLLRRVVAAGETVDADDAHLEEFSWSSDRWLVNGKEQAAFATPEPPVEPEPIPEPAAAVDDTQE